MAVMSIGKEWRRHRRVAQQYFRQDAMSQYYPIQLNKVHMTLQGLLDTPERFDYHNKMCVFYALAHKILGGLPSNFQALDGHPDVDHVRPQSCFSR